MVVTTYIIQVISPHTCTHIHTHTHVHACPCVRRFLQRGDECGRSGGGSRFQLLPVRSSVQEYRARLAGLPAFDLCAVPAVAHAPLRQLLAVSPSGRPSAASFAAGPLLGEDRLLRALAYLDTLLQREPSQKAAFVADLARFWPQFDDRLLRIRWGRESGFERLKSGVIPTTCLLSQGEMRHASERTEGRLRG